MEILLRGQYLIFAAAIKEEKEKKEERRVREKKETKRERKGFGSLSHGQLDTLNQRCFEVLGKNSES